MKLPENSAEWRAHLAAKNAEPVAYEVTRHAATERPFTGRYEAHGQRRVPLHVLRQRIVQLGHQI